MALGDGQLFRLGASAAERLAEDVAEIEHAHLRSGQARDLEGRQARRRAFLDGDLDLAIVERTLAQHLAEFLTGVLAGVAADQRVENALLGGQLGFRLDLFAQALAVIAIAISTRSRAICSTSRPT